MKLPAPIKAATLLLACSASQSYAISEEFIDPKDGMLDASQFLSQRMLGFLPVPIIITEPATGNGLGVMGVFFHESEAQKQGKQTTGIIPENISVLGAAKPCPPYALPGLRMRGVPAARYQNNQAFITEIEATYKLTPRWHLTGFGGAGFVADSWSNLTSDAEDVESYGTGFRYLIAKRYGFTMGVDVAWGPEESAYYIQAGSSC